MVNQSLAIYTLINTCKIRTILNAHRKDEDINVLLRCALPTFGSSNYHKKNACSQIKSQTIHIWKVVIYFEPN